MILTWFQPSWNDVTWLKSFGSLALILTHFWPISRVVWDVPCLRSGKLKQQLFNIVSTLTWTWQVRISNEDVSLWPAWKLCWFHNPGFSNPDELSWFEDGDADQPKFTNARNWFSYRKCFTLIETPLEPGIFQFQLFHTFPLQVALEKHTWQWKIPETPTVSYFFHLFTGNSRLNSHRL